DNAATIPARVVAGAANNLLVHESAAATLAARGIVLAPDFVANGGGAIHLVGREVLGWDAGEVSAHVEGIGDTLHEIFDLARAEKMSTEHAARQLATERLPR
ncbi:MAG: Glu/Leu/Phe/Val dehydrogenase family protein, partial [Pseudonocardiaceae bacterium]